MSQNNYRSLLFVMHKAILDHHGVTNPFGDLPIVSLGCFGDDFHIIADIEGKLMCAIFDADTGKLIEMRGYNGKFTRTH